MSCENCGAVKVTIGDARGPSREVKLGRIRPKSIHYVGRWLVIETPDGRLKMVPRMVAHFNAAKDAVPPPTSTNWRAKAAPAIARMYGNDQYGDCVIASSYHGEGVWSGNEGSAVLATDAEVLNSYHTICGAGDNGCIITDVLDYWTKTGLVFSGNVHKIDGYAAVDWTNKLLMQVVIDVFGGGRFGINLPQAWTSTNTTWTKPSGSGAQIVGGHDIRFIDYDDTGVYASTWGGIVTIPWDVLLDPAKPYFEEAYTELAPDWYASGNAAPNGIDVATLKSDLQLVQGGQTPPLPGPTPPPTPPPNPPPPPAPSGPTAAQVQAYIATVYQSGRYGRCVNVVHSFAQTLYSGIPSLWPSGDCMQAFHHLDAPAQINFSGVLQKIIALIQQYGPAARPYIDTLIAASPMPIWAKAMLTAIADTLLATPATENPPLA